MKKATFSECNLRARLIIGLALIVFALAPSDRILAQSHLVGRPSPYESAVRQPSTDGEQELFRSSMLHVTPPGVSAAKPRGCFVARYPIKKWIRVACGKPSPYPNTVGSGIDFFTATTGSISQATGSFVVYGGLQETGQVPVSAPSPAMNTTRVANTYGLQLNVNLFTPASVCGTSTICQVWEQFIFSNHHQCVTSGCVFIEYWIFNPPGLKQGQCPLGFTYSSLPAGSRPGCFLNTPTTGLSLVPFQSTAVLGKLQLTGQIIGGGINQVSIAPPAPPGKPYTVYSNTYGDIVGLSGGWTGAEYNLVGDCCGLEAFFNSKTTINVMLQTVSGTTTAPTCVGSFSGATMETNNLTLVPGSCTATGGPFPAITFQESNACITAQCLQPVTISYHQVGACNGFATSSGTVSAGGRQAYVIFGIDSIDNSLGTAPFSFDPSNFFVQQSNQADFFDSSLSFYPNILGPFSGTAAVVPAANKLSFSVPGYGAMVVETSNANGAQEASTTPYVLSYSQQPNDPRIIMMNGQTGVTDFTPWPLTQDCHAVVLQ